MDAAEVEVWAHNALGAADLSGVADGDKDLVGLAQDAQALHRQEFRVSRTDPDPDQSPAHARTPALRAAARTSLLGTSGVAAQCRCR